MAPADRASDFSVVGRRYTDHSPAKVYLVGGGIASLAAAAFMIRDGNIHGHNITIFDELDAIGGSLDGAGSAEDGYVLRGGRMLESKYLCTYELFSSIPALDGSKTVTQEIFEWNETMKTSSKSRLVRDGHPQAAPEFGLSEMHILTIERLALEPEVLLGRTSIAEQFDPTFFKTDFWFMWCTTFAFQPWHSAVEFKRYLVRFAHMVAGFNRLQGIMRTVYNQYDSLVRPLHQWLDEHGVVFELNTRVTDLGIYERDGEKTVMRIATERDGKAGEIEVGANDLCSSHLGLDDRGVEPRRHGRGARAERQERRRRLDALGEACLGAARVRTSRGLRRPHRRVQMGVVHHDPARSDLPAHRPGLHRQRARRGRSDHLPAIQLAGLDRHPAPAAFHRPTRRRRACSGVTACSSTSPGTSSRTRCRPAPAARS